MSVVVINRGVQPETIQTAISCYQIGVLDYYLTSSSFGFDHPVARVIKKSFPNLTISAWFFRRVIQIPESRIKRNYFLLELVARFLVFERVVIKLRRFNDYLLKKKAARIVLRLKPRLVIVQDSIGETLRQSAELSETKVIMTVSAAPPQTFNELYEKELDSNPEWFRFYPKTFFSNKVIQEYVKDIESAFLVTAPSNFVARKIQEVSSPQRIEVIPLGFTHSELGLKNFETDINNDPKGIQSPLKCLFVGQIQQRKGIGYLIKGFEMAKLPHGSSLTLVGNINTEFAKFLKTNYHFVKILGHLSRFELGNILKSHDVFIFPSLLEGFSLAVIEALGSGIPVIATEVALPGVIIDKFNGQIIEIANAKSIADQLNWFISHPDEIRRMKTNAHITASKYDWKSYRDSICKIILSLLK